MKRLPPSELDDIERRTRELLRDVRRLLKIARQPAVLDQSEFSRRGGLARAAVLSPEKRREIAAGAVRAREQKRSVPSV